MTEPLTRVEADWRSNREPGWQHDIGYSLLDALRAHRYDYSRKGEKPSDPGWHECDCGWAGYWCDFEVHVAGELRAVAAAVRADERAKVLAEVEAAVLGASDEDPRVIAEPLSAHMIRQYLRKLATEPTS